MSNPKIDTFGNKHWYNKNYRLHREDGPAIEYADGTKAWYLNGKMHREDGPAFEDDSYKAWYLNGNRHRIDGPAIEYLNNFTKDYFINGKQYSSLEEGLMDLALE